MKRETANLLSFGLLGWIVMLAATALLGTSCLKMGNVVNAPTPQPSPTSTTSSNPTPTIAPTALGYPEDTDQIAEFFYVFSNRDYTVADAVAQLRISGKPRTTEKPDGVTSSIYPEQGALIKEVRIDSNKDGLMEIRLTYSHTIKVDFDDLKDRIAPRYSAPPPGSVGFMSAQPSAAANMGPPPILVNGTPSNGRQTYYFAAGGRTYIGRVTISAEDDGSNSSTGTKNVWEVTFSR
ncbi:MAG: hypothetical protein ABI999_06740 [Acidobacteriota bacterium]